MVTQEQVVAQARSLLGVKFAHQGRSLHGLDCLGFLLLLAQRYDLRFDGQRADAIDVVQYGARPDVGLLIEKLAEFLHPIELTELRPADIVLLKIDGSPQHLGLIVDYPMAGELGLIHAYAPARMVVEHRYDLAWQRDSYAAYRLPQFT